MMNSMSIVLLLSSFCASILAQGVLPPVLPLPSGLARRQLRLAKSRKIDPNSVDFKCPAPLTPCPISPITNRSKTSVAVGEPWECLNLMEELTACGSCGENCMDIPHSNSVGCQAGSCKVFSCQPGYAMRTLKDLKSGLMVDACS